MTEGSEKGLYRDELSAAQARANSLQDRLEAAEAQLHDLKNPTKAPPAKAEPATPPPPQFAPLEQRRRIVLSAPATFVPLLRLWVDGMGTASHRVPSVPNPRFDSVVLAILFKVIAVPLIHVFRILYVLHLYLLVAPWTLLLTTGLSVLLTPIVLLSCIRFSDAKRNRNPNWFTGNGNGSTYLWILLSCAGQPLLPLFAPGWDAS